MFNLRLHPPLEKTNYPSYLVNLNKLQVILVMSYVLAYYDNGNK